MALAVVSFETVFADRYLLRVYIVLGAVVYLLAVEALRLVQPVDIDLVEDYLPSQLRGVATKIGAFLVKRKPSGQPQPSCLEVDEERFKALPDGRSRDRSDRSGVIFGIWMSQLHAIEHRIATNVALASMGFMIVGLFMVFAAITLYATIRLVQKITKQ